jgi:hypothetical protein
MTPTTWQRRFRSWLAGLLFALAGKLDAAYDVWLDDAPRRTAEEPPQLGISTADGPMSLREFVVVGAHVCGDGETRAGGWDTCEHCGAA